MRADGLAAGKRPTLSFAAVAWLERSRDWFDARALSRIFTDVDEALWRASGGETTAIVAVAAPYGLCGVSAGDSEAWVIADEKIDRLTALQDRARVGSARARPVVFHRRALEGTLVVATDGLFRHSDSVAIAGACAQAEDLVELPRLASGDYPDDVAVAVVTVDR